METAKVRLTLSLDNMSSNANIWYQNAVNYVAETVQGGGAEASKETNKHVAKDSDASLGSRATAAKDAVVDKKDEASHNTKADVHKGKTENKTRLWHGINTNDIQRPLSTKRVLMQLDCCGIMRYLFLLAPRW